MAFAWPQCHFRPNVPGQSRGVGPGSVWCVSATSLGCPAAGADIGDDDADYDDADADVGDAA
eukprot:scaffold87729_cov20-Tisochrysis_lutea.AAC.1